MSHVYIYGPPGSGKSSNALAWAIRFGCTRVVDEAGSPSEHEVLSGRSRTLFLSQLPPSSGQRSTMICFRLVPVRAFFWSTSGFRLVEER